MCKTIEITEKRCSKCGEVKPVEEFGKSNKTKSGFRSECNLCRRSYYNENKEKIRQKAKKYAEENRQKIAEYRKENKNKINQKRREWYAKNPDKKAKYNAKYRAKYRTNLNKKRHNYFKEFYKNNKRIVLERNSKILKKNIDNLTDRYIKSLLVAHSNLKVSDIDKLEIAPQLIELKRMEIQSKRILNHKKLKV